MKISIITVTFNSAHSLVRCLDSVCNQSYDDFEHVVIDGASNDTTIEILRSRRSMLGAIVSEPDNGIYDAINKGIGRVTGDIVGLIHADDVFSDSFVLHNINEAFNNHPDAEVIIGDVLFYDSSNSNNIIRKYNSSRFRPWMLRFGFMPAHTATFIRRSVFEKIGVYKENYISAGDFEFFIRLFLIYRIKPIFLKKNLVYMSIGGLSTSGWKSHWRTTIEIRRALRDHGIYSNWVFILARLPIKLIDQIIFRIYNILNLSKNRKN
jgi:glycosyltransferase involved in cell wall biosynthesis